jgi:hypothetical protein
MLEFEHFFSQSKIEMHFAFKTVNCVNNETSKVQVKGLNFARKTLSHPQHPSSHPQHLELKKHKPQIKKWPVRGLVREAIGNLRAALPGRRGRPRSAKKSIEIAIVLLTKALEIPSILQRDPSSSPPDSPPSMSTPEKKAPELTVPKAPVRIGIVKKGNGES